MQRSPVNRVGCVEIATQSLEVGMPAELRFEIEKLLLSRQGQAGKPPYVAPRPRHLLAGGVGGDPAFDEGGGDTAGYARPEIIEQFFN